MKLIFQTPVYYTDLNEIENILDRNDDKVLQDIAKTNAMKLNILKKQLEEQQNKQKEEDKQFQDNIKRLVSMQKKKAQKDLPERKWKEDQDYQKNVVFKPKREPRYEEIEEYDIQKDNVADVLLANNLDWGEQLELMKQAVNPYPNNNTTNKGKRGKSPRKKFVNFDPKNRYEIYNGDEIEHPNVSKNRALQLKGYKKQEGDNLDQIGLLERQLAEIRENLKPVINQYASMPIQGPHADLMELAAGRLIKVHSENLMELIIDDLLTENIILLNNIETMEQRNKQQYELKNALNNLLSDIGDMDVDQRHHYQDTLHSKQFLATPREIKNAQKSQKNGNNFESRQHFQGGFDTVHLLSKNINTNNFASSPQRYYEDGDIDSMNVTLTMDPNFIMKVIRDQIMHEDRINEIPFLNPPYVQRAAKVGEKMIDDVIEEVLEVFVRAQDEFLTEVIKSEIK